MKEQCYCNSFSTSLNYAFSSNIENFYYRNTKENLECNCVIRCQHLQTQLLMITKANLQLYILNQ